MCSGITRGRVFTGDLYAQIFRKLIYLHLFAELYMCYEDLSSVVRRTVI